MNELETALMRAVSDPTAIAHFYEVLLASQVLLLTLVEVLTRIFSSYPGIDAACLAQMGDPASGEAPHPLIAVLGNDFRDVLREAGPAAEATTTTPVDFIQIDPRVADGLDGYLLKSGKPFYKRPAPKRPFWKFW